MVPSLSLPLSMTLPSASIFLLAGVPAFTLSSMPPSYPPTSKLLPTALTSPVPYRILSTVLNTSKSSLFLTHVSSAPCSTTSCTGLAIPPPMTNGFLPPNSPMWPTSCLPSTLLISLPRPWPPPVPPLIVEVAAVKRGGYFFLSFPSSFCLHPLFPVPLVFHPPRTPRTPYSTYHVFHHSPLCPRLPCLFPITVLLLSHYFLP